MCRSHDRVTLPARADASCPAPAGTCEPVPPRRPRAAHEASERSRPSMFRSRPYHNAIALMLCGAACAGPALAALDLETALRDVAASSPTLSARSAMVEASRRRVAPAGAWPAPTLEVGVVNVPTSGRFDADPMTMTMIGASQSVPIFGAP